jgi:hypothetical protein
MIESFQAGRWDALRDIRQVTADICRSHGKRQKMLTEDRLSGVDSSYAAGYMSVLAEWRSSSKQKSERAERQRLNLEPLVLLAPPSKQAQNAQGASNV